MATIINEWMYDRGRGPELRSCRITVYDLIPYLEHGDFRDAEMLELWRITAAELDALKQYIAEHRDEVMAVHRQIEERIRREMAAQQTPEFQARFWWNRDRLKQFRTWLRERQMQAEPNANGTTHPPGGEEFAALLCEFRAWTESRPTASETV